MWISEDVIWRSGLYFREYLNSYYHRLLFDWLLFRLKCFVRILSSLQLWQHRRSWSFVCFICRKLSLVWRLNLHFAIIKRYQMHRHRPSSLKLFGNLKQLRTQYLPPHLRHPANFCLNAKLCEYFKLTIWGRWDWGVVHIIFASVSIFISPSKSSK